MEEKNRFANEVCTIVSATCNQYTSSINTIFEHLPEANKAQLKHNYQTTQSYLSSIKSSTKNKQSLEKEIPTFYATLCHITNAIRHIIHGLFLEKDIDTIIQNYVNLLPLLGKVAFINHRIQSQDLTYNPIIALAGNTTTFEQSSFFSEINNNTRNEETYALLQQACKKALKALIPIRIVPQYKQCNTTVITRAQNQKEYLKQLNTELHLQSAFCQNFSVTFILKHISHACASLCDITNALYEINDAQYQYTKLTSLLGELSLSNYYYSSYLLDIIKIYQAKK